MHVVYGTSKRVDRLTAGQFAIHKDANASAFALAGLAFDTKFDLKVLVELPWADSILKVPARASHGQTPKLGTLNPSHIRGAKAAYDAAVAR